MSKPELSVREIQTSDVASLVSYWLDSDPAYLVGMGVDVAKIPSRTDLTKMLAGQVDQPYPEKKAYCIIWQTYGRPVGHSNINNIIYGEEASMHLHLWHPNARKRGLGTELVKMTLPYFFENMKLKKLYCEPYAANPAPHNTLEKVGFTFVKEYITVPGSLNFEQPVKRWELSREGLEKLR